MIKVQVLRNSVGDISGFDVTGHAYTAPHGSDIVCAGVSALTQSAVMGLEQYLHRSMSLDIASGILSMRLLDQPDMLSGAVLETMLLGLNAIAEINPKSVQIYEHRR